jgi:NADPH-dependent ferric siderophore reductase
MSHVSVPVQAPWYAFQRVIRTILVNAVVILPVVNLTLPLVAEAFRADDIPADIYLWVNGVVLGILAVTGLLTRIIAIPAVNAALTRLGAGTIPRAVLKAQEQRAQEPIYERPADVDPPRLDADGASY